MSELLNMETLNSLRELDEPGSNDFLTEIITTYVSDGGARFKGLYAALAAGDVSELGKISHALKGSSLNVGAEGLAAAMQAIEKNAKSGIVCDAGDLSAAEGLFQRVAQTLMAFLG